MMLDWLGFIAGMVLVAIGGAYFAGCLSVILPWLSRSRFFRGGLLTIGALAASCVAGVVLLGNLSVPWTPASTGLMGHVTIIGNTILNLDVQNSVILSDSTNSTGVIIEGNIFSGTKESIVW